MERTVDLTLREIVPMSQAWTIDRLKAVRVLDARFVSVVHHRAHIHSRTRLFARPREIRPRVVIVKPQDERSSRSGFCEYDMHRGGTAGVFAAAIAELHQINIREQTFATTEQNR